MRPRHHTIYRKTAKRITASQYNEFVAGALYAPVFAGLFGAFLAERPVIFLAYVGVVLYAARKQIEASRDSVIGRLKVWPQFIVLFISSFTGVAALMQGSRELFAFLIFVIPPLLIEFHNRRRHYRAFYFHAARSCIRDARTGS